MKKDYSQSDRKMRDKIGGLEMTPPTEAWAGIEQQLGAVRPKRGSVFYFIASLLFLVVVGGATFTYLYFASDGSLKHDLHSENHVETTEIVTPSKEDSRAVSSPSEATNSPSTENEKTAQSGITSPAPVQLDAKQAQRTGKTTISEQQGTQTITNKTNSNRKSPETNDGISTSSLKNKTTENQTATNNEITRFAINGGAIAVSGDTRVTHPNSEERANENLANEENIDPTAELALGTLLPRTLLPLPFAATTNNSILAVKENRSKFRKGGWSAEAGIGLSSYRYTPTSGSPALQQALKDAQSGEQSMQAFARVNYHVNNTLSFHTGVNYQQEKGEWNYTTSSTSSQMVYDTVWYYDTVLQQQLYYLDSNQLNITTTQNHQLLNQASYISIPLGVMFSFPLGIRSEIGLSASTVLGIRTKSQGAVLTDENGNSLALDDAYKKIGILTFKTSLRYTFALDEKNKVYVEPWVGFGLNNRSNAGLPYDTRFTSGGVRLGFRRSF